MKLFKKTLIVLAVIAVVFAGVVALQPADYRVVRTATISAPPSAVFPLVNNFRKWEAWSPWAKLDPAAKNTFEGPEEGAGSSFAWAGNDKVGEGRMTLLESRLGELVRIKLEFIKPFASTCATDFAFHPEGNGTVVTWTMAGANNFIGKAFCLFMNMDKMVGGDFERGLASMKAAAESASERQPSLTLGDPKK